MFSKGAYVSNTRRKALLSSAAILALAGLAEQAHAGSLINPDSLLISTTMYQDIGAVAGLVAGSSQLPGANAGASSIAVSNGDLNTVWNNASVDPSFGVTSAITIQDLSVWSAAPKVLASQTLDAGQVVTSFPSKSELGLNIAQTSAGKVVTFMGYAPGGGAHPATAVGMLDISNSDTTAYSDPTNPVTSFFGANHAFNRSVVALNSNGSYTVTQTLAYGGNNGRTALLAPNGLYYTTGNSNNGSGTPTQLTKSTGLSVVTPGATPNSTMIDPTFTTYPGYQTYSKDKAGKSSNFRGLTYYAGQLYFTKGSGGNGIDTVYTVSNPGGHLPTAATANSAVVSILPGFSTQSAKQGPDFTPFGLFFANSTTLYVADEGSGDATDVSTNAGLEKWTLSSGTWHLDYTLRAGLIGQTYDVPGWNFEETTVGLRNLTGRLNADGTVSLWATTATTSGSGDNGADPNMIVKITDLLSDTSLPSESFSTVDGPLAGLRYGGVAYAAAPEASTWAMLVLGFSGVAFTAARRGGKSGRRVSAA